MMEPCLGDVLPGQQNSSQTEINHCYTAGALAEILAYIQMENPDLSTHNCKIAKVSFWGYN